MRHSRSPGQPAQRVARRWSRTRLSAPFPRIVSTVPGWEFAYVDLFLGYEKSHDAVDVVKGAIARYGAEGWEPVGVVSFEYDTAGPLAHSGRTLYRQLMFKRALDNG